MSYRTPSKLLFTIRTYPYVVRYVLHGGLIKFSSIINNLNSKPITGLPKEIRSVMFEGFTVYNDLKNYPDINHGSDFNLISSLPESLRLELKQHGDKITVNPDNCLSLFVYKMES